MKLLALFVALSGALLAQQKSAVISSDGYAEVVLDSRFAKVGAASNRVEFRLHGLTTPLPQASKYVALVGGGAVGTLYGNSPVSFGYLVGGYGTDGLFNNSATAAFPACCVDNDVVVRITRDVTAGKAITETWNYFRGTYMSGSSTLTVRYQSWQNMLFRLYPGASFAYLHWFSTTVPKGTSVDPNARGDLGNWEFDGNLSDSSPNALHMAVRAGTVSYVDTPGVPPPPDCKTRPVISNVAVAAVSPTSLKFTWKTDCYSDSRVSWSLDEDFDRYTPASDTVGALDHAVTLTGLIPGRSYHAWVVSSAITDPRLISNNADLYGSAVTPPPLPGPLEYTGGISGSHEVYQGGTVYLLWTTDILQGTDNYWYSLDVSGLPPGASLQQGKNKWINPAKPNRLNLYRLYTYGEHFGISTAADTPPGDYVITAVGGSNYGPSYGYKPVTDGVPAPRTFTWKLKVLPPAQFTVHHPTSYPPIPCLSASSKRIDGTTCANSFEQIMVKYGQQYCTQQTAYWEGGVWYYDATRVYWQVRDYDRQHIVSGNPSQWDACIANQWKGYYDSVMAQLPTAWRVFPDGFGLHYRAFGDAESRSALVDRLRITPYADVLAPGGALIDISKFRELAYRLDTEIVDNDVIADGTRLPYLRKTFDVSLGRVSQIIDGGVYNLQPFMVGLWAESLIKCYTTPTCPYYEDARIPVSIKRVADALWAKAWSTPNAPNQMYYLQVKAELGLVPDYWRSLHLLISPIYGWLYWMTGDPVYEQRHDLLFETWTNSPPDKGKDYSQGYRWGFAGVQWRSAPTSAYK